MAELDVAIDPGVVEVLDQGMIGGGEFDGQRVELPDAGGDVAVDR
jgi:hypothetical protein